MPVEAEKLLRFEIPSVRQMLTPRDCAFYALSIGIGADPLETRAIAFADPLAGPAVVPSMVLVIAHPGFWLGHPDSGVDPLTVLHVSQRFEIFAPIPVGTEVESRTRVTDLIDKGPGKPALIFTGTDLFDAAGKCFAHLDRTTFVRGGGGFGGESHSPHQSPSLAPDTPPDSIVDLPTRPEQALLYRLNGDLNPLHSDPSVAAMAGFERPILHGLGTAGVIVHALLRSQFDYQANRLTGLSLRFASHVLPGETIRTEIWKDGRFRARVVERDTLIVDQGSFTGPVNTILS